MEIEVTTTLEQPADGSILKNVFDSRDPLDKERVYKAVERFISRSFGEAKNDCDQLDEFLEYEGKGSATTNKAPTSASVKKKNAACVHTDHVDLTGDHEPADAGNSAISSHVHSHGPSKGLRSLPPVNYSGDSKKHKKTPEEVILFLRIDL